jgi:hypothetical protein
MAAQMKREVTIAIEDEGISSRKITKIIRLKDGFAVAVPYHNANRGWLLKMPVDYSKTVGVTPVNQMIQYTLETKAKLSFHLSGFVHFSGRGVRSGFDPVTGEVKGLGLKLKSPVRIVTGGPAFALTLWGLADFQELGDKRSDVEVFQKGDFYFRGSADAWRGYVVEGFLMRWEESGSGVTNRLGRMRWVGSLPYISPIFFRHELRVIDLPGLGYFLGIMVSRLPFDGGLVAGSGFCLSGPSSCGCNDIWPKTIMAIYPFPEDLPREETTTLDYPT